MGVRGLSALLKGFASKRIALDDVDEGHGAGNHIVVDGHFELHRAAGTGPVAVPLVVDDNVVPLAMSMANNLNKLRNVGWDLTVVFDGRTPPSKEGTAQSRSDDRMEARGRCFELLNEEQNTGTHNAQALAKAATRAVSFSSSIVRRVARIIEHVLRCECVIAPYESDPQLKVLEDLFIRNGKRCLVRGTDSDLVVLGVQSLLWNVVEEAGGRLFGEVILLSAVTHPQMAVLDGQSDAHEFARLLHGIEKGDAISDDAWWGADSDAVTRRLQLWSSVAGDDYSRYAGIGTKKAMDICLRRTSSGEFPTREGVVGALVASTSQSAADVTYSLETSRIMCCHPVVYSLDLGQQQHMSGCPSTQDITQRTGTLQPPDVARKIASGAICPVTLEPWGSDFTEALGEIPQLESLALPNRKRRKRAPPGDTNNYHRTGFSRLPQDCQLEGMTVSQLREFLEPFRCFEQAGTSAMTRDTLLDMAKGCVKVVERSGLVGSSMVFRRPQESDPKLQLSQPADGWLDWKSLREHLPEFSGDCIIIAWLRKTGSIVGETGRTLYRGMERVLDLGALDWMSGIPCGENGGTLHARMKVPGSMRSDKVYLVQADINVERVNVASPGCDVIHPSDYISTDEVASKEPEVRLVATAVLAAWCQCQSGAGGGCHHCCQLLHLLRLLQLTERELETWNPDSPTSVACQWILRHHGGRGTEFDQFHLKTLAEVAAVVRTLRDPKRVPFTGGVGEEPKTKGVVAMDRRADFSSHPDHGEWADARQHFDEGKTINSEEWDLLKTFADGERVETEWGGDRVALDVLPTRIRPDSPVNTNADL